MHHSKKKTIIIGIFLREQSALSEYFLKMAEEFIALGYRVIIISDENRKDLVDTTSNPMILTWPSYHPNTFQDFLFIRTLLKTYQPEMLISNFNATNLFLMAGFLYGVPHRIAWLHTVSSAISETAKWRFWRKKYIFKIGTHFIANSYATKNDAINTYSIEKRKISVLPNLIYSNKKYISSEKEWKLTFIGRFHHSKGIDVLIKAMVLVVKAFPTIKLELIAGEDDSYYRNLIKEYSLEKNIIILGRLEREKVLQHLSTTQLSIVPSLAEAFGYVVIESFSVKVPVVGSDTGGIAEIITNDENGVLFPVGNDKALAKAIIHVLKDNTMRKKYARNALRSFNETYELNQNMPNYVKMFQKIIEG